MVARTMPILDVLLGTFADWLSRRREMRELSEIDRNEFAHIASDLQISPSVLDELVRRGPHAVDELPKMLDALGVDQAALARTQPRLLRDMEQVCALCGQKRRCDRDLASGSVGDHYQDYCPNAHTIMQLDRQSRD
jgi:uncharacterized protein YjiS (DUF1127 family)